MKLVRNLAVLFALTIAFSVTFFSCSKVNTGGDATGGTGSNKRVIDPQQAIESVYPHSEIKNFMGLHGKFYVKGASCTSCHGEELKGGSAKISCNSCHKSYPHTDEFKTSFEHGTEYLKSQRQENVITSGECVGCHKANRIVEGKGEIKREKMKSCQDCHSFPHGKSNWVKVIHGQEFEEKGVAACLTCHTKESGFASRNPELFRGCLDCHSNDPRKGINPHQTGFMKRSSHGYKVSEVGIKNCTICHDNGPKAKSCNFCHKTYPHNTIADLSESDFYDGMHGELYNEDSKKCQRCHGNKDTKIKVSAKCMDCHDSIDMAPESHKSTEFVFGEHSAKYKENAANCTICHEPKAEGVPPQTCSACHDKIE